MDIFKSMNAFLSDFVGEILDVSWEESGKWHSLKTERFKGAYIFSSHKHKDSVVYVVTVRNWRSDHTESKTFGAEGLSKKELASIKKLEIDLLEKSKAERERLNREAQKFCLNIWNETPSQLFPTPYSERKRIDVCGNVKTRTTLLGKDILVGMYDEAGEFWGYQVIRPDGAKDFQEGQRLKGIFGKIPGDAAKKVYIAEGYATAASIFMATGCTTYIAFSANNIPSVAHAVRKLHPKTAIVICADDDKYKPEAGNIGVEKATQAAKDIDASVAVPTFLDETTKPTDWNDLLCLEGMKELQAQLAAVKLTKPLVLYYLGYSGATYFLSSTSNPQLNSVTEMSPTDLLKVMPLRYWERMYGEALPFGGIQVDWMKAKDDCISGCQRAGIFHGEKMRGLGVWLDQGRVVEHFGETLRVDGEVMHLQDLESNYIYEIRTSNPVIKAEPIHPDSVREMLSVLAELAWRDKVHTKLYLGTLACSFIAGALSWRPHVLVTGEAGSGKTTLLHFVTEPLLECLTPHRVSSTTEAGLRQMVKNDSVPVLLDEFDMNMSSPKRISALLDLVRSASSGDTVRRGTPSGKSLHFLAHFPCFMYGINPPVLNEADQSRITVMSLQKKHSGSWPLLEKRLCETFTREAGERIYSRMVESLPTFGKLVKEFHTEISQKFSQRKAQQYGVMLAAYSVISGESMEALVAEWTEKETEENLSEESGPIECLRHLLEMKIEGNDEQTRGLNTLISMLSVKGNPQLEMYFMKYDKGKLFVPLKNPRISAWFEKTQWVKYSAALKRIEGCEDVVVKIGKMTVRGVYVPLKVAGYDTMMEV